MGATPTINTIYNKQLTYERELAGLQAQINDLKRSLNSKASGSDLAAEINAINDKLTDYNNVLGEIEEKLGKIILPSDTRYYLKESEITDFRNHFRQLRAMMSDIENTRQSLIRLVSRYNLTSSQL